jgi:hypothetical protein
MTKEEFENCYISHSKITQKFYDEHFITLPCHCGEDICDGWAAVRNDQDSIDMHNKVYT